MTASRRVEPRIVNARLIVLSWEPNTISIAHSTDVSIFLTPNPSEFDFSDRDTSSGAIQRPNIYVGKQSDHARGCR